jgi:hypothetical protein
MLTGPALTKRATELQKEVNERIKVEYGRWSRYEVGYRVEEICAELLADSWDWRLLEAVGQEPRVIITAYRGHFV